MGRKNAEGGKGMKLRRILLITSLLLCTILSVNPFIRQLINLPEYSEKTQLTFIKPSGILAKIVSVDLTPKANLEISQPVVTDNSSKDFQVSYKLFGIFPFKSSQIEVMPSIKLLPGGQSIGVTLQAKGVMIVGQAPVTLKDGVKIFPAKDAGIETGDTIFKINGQEVHTDQDVADVINEAGKNQESVILQIKHQNQTLEKKVKTIYCEESKRYRIGLFVRDEAAGVGTLTFIDLISQKYGALGHVINDADTNQRIEVSNGRITSSTIYGIEKGNRGHPGEKLGTFVNGSIFNGTIEKNSSVGIFGRFNGKIPTTFFKDSIYVGWENEIKEGPAKIYTVIHGEQVEEFNVKVERIMHNRTDSKNMVILVTDPKLIEITGGIIQGMSGSPIVQDGKIIGAVTHVFINDARRGYGVFIQNMLKESGILEKKEAA